MKTHSIIYNWETTVIQVESGKRGYRKLVNLLSFTESVLESVNFPSKFFKERRSSLREKKHKNFQ